MTMIAEALRPATYTEVEAVNPTDIEQTVTAGVAYFPGNTYIVGTFAGRYVDMPLARLGSFGDRDR